MLAAVNAAMTCSFFARFAETFAVGAIPASADRERREKSCHPAARTGPDSLAQVTASLSEPG